MQSKLRLSRFLSLLGISFVTIQPSWAIVHGTKIAAHAYTDVGKIVTVDTDGVTPLSKCSGVFISPQFFLTAGHCVHDGKISFDSDSFRLVTRTQKAISNDAKQLVPGTAYTEFTDDLSALFKAEHVPDPNAVSGCSLQEIPVIHTQTPDLALIRFDQATPGAVATLSETIPQIGDSIQYVGYGSTELDPFDEMSALIDAFEDALTVHKSSGAAKIWRMNDQRLAFKENVEGQYASFGDSGTPVYRDGKVVGLLSTIDENCETKFGTDYGIEVTATLLGTPEAKAFLARAEAALAKSAKTP
jgi:hypothetical protein